MDAGQSTAVVGATGSGKTTMGRMLFRFYDPLQGSVLINGQDIKNVTMVRCYVYIIAHRSGRELGRVA